MQLSNKENIEAVARLINGITHDYNNKIAIISGYADLLNKMPGCAEASQFIGPITSASEDAIALSEKLLGFARRNFKETEIIIVRDFINEITEQMRKVLPEDANFSIEVDGDLGQIKADAEDFKQVVLDLLENAKEASSKDGVYRIEIKNRTLNGDESVNQDLEAGEYIVLSVIDSGDGIAEDDLEKIYYPSYTTHKQKDGMGLSHAYGFACRVRGKIECQSTLGEGSRFNLYLPKV